MLVMPHGSTASLRFRQHFAFNTTAVWKHHVSSWLLCNLTEPTNSTAKCHATPFLPAARCTPISCNGDQYCAATGSCTNCDTIGAGRCTACTSGSQCTACQSGWTGATCHQQSKQATQQRLLAMCSLHAVCATIPCLHSRCVALPPPVGQFNHWHARQPPSHARALRPLLQLRLSRQQ